MYPNLKPIFAALMLLSALPACKKGNPPPDPSIPQNQSPKAKITVLPNTFNETLRSVYFLNENTGYVAGALGGIYKTENGGQTWTTQTSGVTLPIYGIYFIDANKGFAVGGDASCGGTGCVPPGGFILQTLNGGQTWTQIYTPADKIDVDDIYFTNATTGFAIAYGNVYKTTNGGQTWNVTVNNPGIKTMHISFSDAQHGYITSLSDKVIQTSDGGKTWQIKFMQFGLGYYDVSSGSNYAYVSGQGKVLKSTDNGASWNQLGNSPANVFALYFADAGNGIAFGRGDYTGGDFGMYLTSLYTTTDGGQTWAGRTDIKDYSIPYKINFPTKTIGYGAAGNKVIKIDMNGN